MDRLLRWGYSFWVSDNGGVQYKPAPSKVVVPKKAAPPPPPPKVPPPVLGETQGHATGRRASTPSRAKALGTPSTYRSIAHFPAVREFADGSRLVQQLNAHPPGMAPLRETPGSLRSVTTGRGAALPVDGVHMVSGIYIAGLDRNIGEKQFILEFPGSVPSPRYAFPETVREHWRGTP